VLKKYFHIFYIPFFPYGKKITLITCNSCGNNVQNEELQRHYEQLAKPSLKYYAGLLILAALILAIVFAGISGKKDEARYLAAPQVGDVYTIKSQANNYYFLRLSEMKGDSLFAYHSNLEYNRYVTKFNKDDFFVKDEVYGFTKNGLKAMKDSGELISVSRNYSDYKGFNRIK
jgi:hypothetical protein